MKFRDLLIGDTFDFLNDEKPMFNSFYERCEKISARKYKGLDNRIEYRVGSINASVHHVQPRGTDSKYWLKSHAMEI
jgi:hypothetical protein